MQQLCSVLCLGKVRSRTSSHSFIFGSANYNTLKGCKRVKNKTEIHGTTYMYGNKRPIHREQSIASRSRKSKHRTLMPKINDTPPCSHCFLFPTQHPCTLRSQGRVGRFGQTQGNNTWDTTGGTIHTYTDIYTRIYTKIHIMYR